MRILLLCLLLLGWGSLAGAHGLAWQADPGPATAVLFTYAGGEPMAYASIKVFAPNEAAVEYQNAHTDQTGRFAFVPRVPGQWRIVADDGMGHRQEAVLGIDMPSAATGIHAGIAPAPAASAGAAVGPSATALQQSTNTSSTGTPFGLRLALGLSVLGNIFCGLYIMRTNKCTTLPKG